MTKLSGARREASRVIDEFKAELVEKYGDTRDDLQGRVMAVVEGYRARVRELSESLARDLEVFKPELEALWQAIHSDLDDFDVGSLPDVPEPELPPDDTHWLFDSSRDYFEQLMVYKARGSKGAGAGV